MFEAQIVSSQQGFYVTNTAGTNAVIQADTNKNVDISAGTTTGGTINFFHNSLYPTTGPQTPLPYIYLDNSTATNNLGTNSITTQTASLKFANSTLTYGSIFAFNQNSTENGLYIYGQQFVTVNTANGFFINIGGNSTGTSTGQGIASFSRTSSTISAASSITGTPSTVATFSSSSTNIYVTAGGGNMQSSTIPVVGITSNGLGIGTASPSRQLDVKGDAIISGGLTFGSALYGSIVGISSVGLNGASTLGPGLKIGNGTNGTGYIGIEIPGSITSACAICFFNGSTFAGIIKTDTTNGLQINAQGTGMPLILSSADVIKISPSNGVVATFSSDAYSLTISGTTTNYNSGNLKITTNNKSKRIGDFSFLNAATTNLYPSPGLCIESSDLAYSRLYMGVFNTSGNAGGGLSGAYIQSCSSFNNYIGDSLASSLYINSKGGDVIIGGSTTGGSAVSFASQVLIPSGSTSATGSGVYLLMDNKTSANGGVFSGTLSGIGFICNNNILVNAVYYSSDQRMKKNIKSVDTSSLLETLNTIQLRYFNYIDTIVYAPQTELGFIAQEVKDIYPNAVTTHKSEIPSIYTVATNVALSLDGTNIIISVIIPCTSNLVVGGNVHLLIENKKEKHIAIVVSFTEYQLVVPVWEDFNLTDKVFVYGPVVDDCHGVDETQFISLCMGGVQELSKRNDALTAQVSTLQTQMNTLMQQMATLLEKN